MNLSENLRQDIDRTADRLLSESNLAQRRFLAFEGLITDLRYLQQHDPVIDPKGAAAVAQWPDVNDLRLKASYPAPWTDLYLNAIINPTHFNLNHCLTVAAMQITDQSGLPEQQDVHLIPAIICMFPAVHRDVETDTDSPVELTATIGRTGINVEHLPFWWPNLLKDAADMALNRVIADAAQTVEENNVPLFHHDDLGRFMPTTSKAKHLSRALFLRALAKHHPLPIDPDLDQHFQYVADQQITAWITHAINRFPQQLVPDDCNYVAATGAIIRPDEQLTIHQAAVQLTDRYDNPLADQEPSHNAIRIILHDSDPTYSHVHIPDNLDQYSHRIGNLAAMLASVLARPLQHPEQHHVAIAIIGRIIRTASICSNIHLPTISTNTAIAILVTHALEDIAILAPTLPTELVAPLHRDILIATNAGRISAVHTLTPNSQPET